MTRSLHIPSKQFLAVALLVLAMLGSMATAAWSAPLDDAKAAGLIGERPDGYVAAVQSNPPPDIARLVQEVNAKRRAAYEDIAAKQGVPLEQVGALTAEKIRAQAGPGEYFMTPGGWTQK
ncbi:MAG: YdbL family protein [Dongiaceae bacterium]